MSFFFFALLCFSLSNTAHYYVCGLGYKHSRLFALRLEMQLFKMLFVLFNLTLISSPVEHAPVSTSPASAPAPHASAHQPATAAQNTASLMTPPAATPTSVVQESFSSSFHR